MPEEYQGYYADCYVLTELRTREFVKAFLDKFIPNRDEKAYEYEVPQYSEDTNVVFKTAIELIEYLEKNKNIPYTIYWSNNEKTELKGAMCFFTTDGNLIIGLYCDTKYSDTIIEDNYLNELMLFSGSTKGYIAYEEPASNNTEEFLKRIK